MKPSDSLLDLSGEQSTALQEYRESLVAWGQIHTRIFPWRVTDDPYRILVAEIMLHRTRVRQVVPVYTRFIERYPDVASLVGASRGDLHVVLHSLGLRWRIDLLANMATELAVRFDSVIPQDRVALESLPGISDYIASAIRCFAFASPEPLIDTNTVRVIGRVFGFAIKPSSRRDRRFRQAIAALTDPVRPQAYNYALLDLAHLVCYARRVPECQRCPLLQYCTTGQGEPKTDFPPPV